MKGNLDARPKAPRPGMMIDSILAGRDWYCGEKIVGVMNWKAIDAQFPRRAFNPYFRTVIRSKGRPTAPT